MPIDSAYRVNLFFTSSTFWEFVSVRNMNSNFKTLKYTADWKEKQTWSNVINRKSYFPKMCKKNRLILKHPKNQTPAEKVSLVKRINEGYFLFCLFLFLVFLPKK